jgi:hypothetical protein
MSGFAHIPDKALRGREGRDMTQSDPFEAPLLLLFLKQLKAFGAVSVSE